MKRFILYLLAASSIIACAKFDDSEIWNKLDDHEERIKTLETLCTQMNTNIGALQTIVAALQKNDYVTNVVAIMESGVEYLYMLYVSDLGGADPVRCIKE